MADIEDEEPGLADDLYAFVVYMHVESTHDLVGGIKGEEISLSQLELLAQLRGGIRPNVNEASKLIGRSQQATSRLVDQLARRGLVRREGDDTDFRAKRLVITERGDSAIARLHAARYEQCVAFTDNLTGDEREQLQGAMRRLLDREEIRRFRPVQAAA